MTAPGAEGTRDVDLEDYHWWPLCETRRPTHPGEILRADVLPALEMTQTELAERLGVSRLTVSDLLHGKRTLSADMAVRLAKLLGTSPESWLNVQQSVDLWELEQAEENYRQIKPVPQAT